MVTSNFILLFILLNFANCNLYPNYGLTAGLIKTSENSNGMNFNCQLNLNRNPRDLKWKLLSYDHEKKCKRFATDNLTRIYKVNTENWNLGIPLCGK